MISVSCVTFDCSDPELVSALWAGALGWQKRGDRAEPPGGGVYLEFCRVPEPKAVKNRVHLGLHTTGDLDAEIDRLMALGASVAWEEAFPAEWPFRNVVMRDPEGNEFCLGDEDPEEAKRLLGI